MSTKLTGFRLVLIVGVLVGVAGVSAQTRPLPDSETFLRETRARLQTDYTLQRSYAYVETRRELKLDKAGRTVEESVKVIESYPGLPGEEGRWERVVSINGKPVPEKELAERDRDRQKKAQAFAARQASEPDKAQARQSRDVGDQRQRITRAVDDIFLVYDIRMVGRESVDGHDAIALTLTPRPDARPRTRDGGIMRRFLVHAWISEADYELVRVEAEAIETLSFGWGLLARIHEGTRMSFERRKVNGEVWLPARTSYVGSARVGLVRTLRRSGTSEFSAYRKFAVDASATYETPR